MYECWFDECRSSGNVVFELWIKIDQRELLKENNYDERYMFLYGLYWFAMDSTILFCISTTITRTRL